MINNRENKQIFKGIETSKREFENILGVVLTPKVDNVTKNYFPNWEKTSRDDIGDFVFNGFVVCFYPVWNEKQGFEIKRECGHNEEVLYIIQTCHTQKAWQEIIKQEQNKEEIRKILGL